jgi:iron complex outermembrane receptor protein
LQASQPISKEFFMFRRFPPSRQRVLSVAIAAALGGLQASAALAAETPATTESQQALPEVRVQAKAEREDGRGPVTGVVARRTATGTKTDVPIIEVPQAISVITKDEITRGGASNLKEVLAYTPGVTPVLAIDNREDLVTFRGFAFDWNSFFIDGMATPATTYGLARGEAYGMERVEVLHGASASLFGQNPAGGMVNLVTKKPVLAPLREVQLTLGSNQRRQGAFDLGGALTPDGQWSYRLTGLVRKARTDVEYVRDDRNFIAPALTWSPSAATKLTVLAHYIKDDLGHSGGTSAFLPASGIARPNANGTIDRDTNGGEPAFDMYRKEQTSVGYDLDQKLTDTWSFRQSLRYRSVRLSYQTAYGLAYVPAASLPPGTPANLYYNRGAFGSFGNNEMVTLDNQFQADQQGQGWEHKALVGLDFRNSTLREIRYFGAGTPINVFDPVYGAPQTLPAAPDTDQQIGVRQLGVYAQSQLKFAKQWLITTGLRADSVRTSFDTALLPSASRTRHENALTGRIGFTYLAPFGLAPYISYATGFTPTSGADYDGNLFKARTSKQAEAGIKYQPTGLNALFTAALFDITQRHVLTRDPDPAHPFYQVQQGEYRSRGLELEAKGGLTKSLDVVASYTRLNPEITESNSFNVGNRPRGIPLETFAARLDYTIRSGVARGLGFSVGMQHIGASPSSDGARTSAAVAPANYYFVPAFNLVNAGVRYEQGPVEWILNVTNVEDKTTYDCWAAKCWYGPGRDARLTMIYRW